MVIILTDNLKDYFINCILQGIHGFITNSDILNFINLYKLNISNSDKYNRFKIVEILLKNNLLENFYNIHKNKIFIPLKTAALILNIDNKKLVSLFHTGYFPTAYCRMRYKNQMYMLPITILEKELLEIESDYNKITSSCISNNFVLKIQETNLEELQRKVNFF